MPGAIEYREANSSDLQAVARLRSGDEQYWITRVTAYFNKEQHPQQALLPRVIYVAIDSEKIIGMIAGHLTKRFGCDGELQWIDVTEEYRGKGIAAELLQMLSKWFIEQKAFFVCVDVGSEAGRKFYKKFGAENINEHWMGWKDIRVVLKYGKQ